MDKEKERLNAIKMQEDHNKMLDEFDRKRAEEWAAREARIQNAMGRMADTVLKKNNQAEKELEKRVLQYAEELDRKAAEREQNDKRAARQRDIDIKATLDQQLQEKRDKRDREMATNREYVAMVIARDEADKKEQRDKEKKTLHKL